MHIKYALCFLMVLVFLTACAPRSGTGTLVLKITDAPAALNIQKALVTISMVQVHKAGTEGNETANVTTEAGWITVVAEPQTFDLIAIKDVKEFLGSKALEPGKYTQIRLSVQKALVTIDNKEYDLTVPSEKIKLIKPFTIVAGQNTTLVLDFDAQQSIGSSGSGKYNMRPTIKVMEG